MTAKGHLAGLLRPLPLLSRVRSASCLRCLDIGVTAICLLERLAMDQPPFAFYVAYRSKLEGRASVRSSRPLAEPFMGAIGVGFGAALIASLTLSIGGDSALSEYRLESIASMVAALTGGIAYLFLRGQHRAFNAAIEYEGRLAWDGQEGNEYRQNAVK